MHAFQKRYLIPYSIFWFAIAAVYEALFMLEPDVEVGRAIAAGLTIIGIAAVLGLLVLSTSMRAPMPQEDIVRCLLVHAIGATLYSLSWVAALILTRILQVFLTTGELGLQYPAGYVLRWHFVAGPALYAAIVSAALAIRSVEAAERTRRNADLRTLRAQLNPHFLFNSLHTIMMLFRTDRAKAESALEQFSDLIRYSFHDPDENHRENQHALVKLGQEWEFAEKYLDLQRLRLGDRFSLSSNIETDSLQCYCPQLLLQPLLENAIVHGGEDGERKKAELKIKKQADKIHISIVNDVSQSTEEATTGFGIGLRAVSARLESAFERGSHLQAGRVGDRYRVDIVIPAVESLSA